MVLHLLFGAASQRFALPALGRAAERRPTGKMLRRRKRLGIAPESPASGARFVGRVYGGRLFANYSYQTLLPFLVEIRKVFQEPFEYFHQAKRQCL